MCKISIFAQTNTVEEFGRNMTQWCITKNGQYRMRAKNMTEDNCRVIDSAMEIFAKQESVQDNHYFIDNYLNGFQNTLRDGDIKYTMKNVCVVTKDKQLNKSTAYNNQASLADKCSVITCEVQMSGAFNVYEKLSFYIYNESNKIVKIEPTKEIVDQQTGERKVEVTYNDIDWEEIISVPDEDIKTFVISYNYSKDFPLGFSVDYSWSWFQLGLSAGFNTDKKNQLYTDKLNMTDIMNFSRERGVYDPKGYALITPSVYLTHFSVGCGFGILDLEGDFEQTVASSKTFSGGDGQTVSFPFTSTTSTDSKIMFMVQPKLSYYISFDGDYEEGIGLNISLGYNHIPKYTRMNGFNIGIGFVIYGF